MVNNSIILVNNNYNLLKINKYRRSTKIGGKDGEKKPTEGVKEENTTAVKIQKRKRRRGKDAEEDKKKSAAETKKSNEKAIESIKKMAETAQTQTDQAQGITFLLFIIKNNYF